MRAVVDVRFRFYDSIESHAIGNAEVNETLDAGMPLEGNADKTALFTGIRSPITPDRAYGVRVRARLRILSAQTGNQISSYTAETELRIWRRRLDGPMNTPPDVLDFFDTAATDLSVYRLDISTIQVDQIATSFVGFRSPQRMRVNLESDATGSVGSIFAKEHMVGLVFYRHEFFSRFEMVARYYAQLSSGRSFEVTGTRRILTRYLVPQVPSGPITGSADRTISHVGICDTFIGKLYDESFLLDSDYRDHPIVPD